VLGFCILSTSQEIDWKEYLQNELFDVERYVNNTVSQYDSNGVWAKLLLNPLNSYALYYVTDNWLYGIIL